MTAPVEELAAQIRAGVPAAIARAITLCERGGSQARHLLTALPSRNGHVVGLTGPPGVGKSTLASQLVHVYRGQDVTVGVIAVDPSSPLTGGALLGDRVRMEGITGDRGVFFRSLASRGESGGLSSATRAAVHVLLAAGFDLVLIETVGTGQGEVEIMRVAETVVLVLQPGAGDDLQALKAGLMEIADVYVLNKADQPGIERLRRDVKLSIRLREETAWMPPLVETVASKGVGIEKLAHALARHREHLAAGTKDAPVAEATRAAVVRIARATFDAALAEQQREIFAELEAGCLDKVEAGQELARRAARRIVETGERCRD